MVEDSGSKIPDLGELAQEVVITPEDVIGAAEFWAQFNVPMPPELRAAFDAFVANPTIKNQIEVRHHLVSAIGYSDHEVFDDEMFVEIRNECKDIDFNMSFDKDLEDHLTREDK